MVSVVCLLSWMQSRHWLSTLTLPDCTAARSLPGTDRGRKGLDRSTSTCTYLIQPSAVTCASQVWFRSKATCELLCSTNEKQVWPSARGRTAHNVRTPLPRALQTVSSELAHFVCLLVQLKLDLRSHSTISGAATHSEAPSIAHCLRPNFPWCTARVLTAIQAELVARREQSAKPVTASVILSTQALAYQELAFGARPWLSSAAGAWISMPMRARS